MPFGGALDAGLPARAGRTLSIGSLRERLAQCLGEFAAPSKNGTRDLRHGLVDHPADGRLTSGFSSEAGGGMCFRMAVPPLHSLPRVEWHAGGSASHSTPLPARRCPRAGVAGFISICSGDMYISVPLCPIMESRVRHVGDAEIDDLHGIVVHDENIARLEIAVNQAVLMGRLQSPARLCRQSPPSVPPSAGAGTLMS